MKALFLDFDGVLNNNTATSTNAPPEKWKAKHPFIWIEKEKCELLNTLFDDPDLADTKIVISSTWRTTFQQEELMEILNGQVPGLGDRVIGTTKVLDDYDYFTRGREVYAWLEDYQGLGVTAFAIIDDNDWFFSEQRPNFVWTGGFKGLLADDVENARRILKGEPLNAEFA